MKLNQFFSHIACVNLDRRPDRWQRMQARFASAGIMGVERFPAVDGRSLTIPADWTDSPAAYGCLQSHLELVTRARDSGWPNLLIFEDDVEFAPDFEEKFAMCQRQVPADWDMLYLGASHLGEPARPATNLLRLTRSSSTFAYALNRSVYESNIAINLQGRKAVDVNNHGLQARFGCYCFHPSLAWVDKDYSDIGGNTRDFWWLRESLIMDGEDIRAVRNQTLIVLPLQPRGWEQEEQSEIPPTVEHYLRVMPGVEIVLVDTGCEPNPPPAPLPARCHYLFADPALSGGHGHGFNAAFREFRMRKQFFVFQEGNIFMHSNELSANLLMALRYDFVSCFSQLFELDEAASRTLLTTGRWTTNGYTPLPPAEWHGGSWLLTRQGCDLAGELLADGATDPSIHARQLAGRLRTFTSPGQAFRIPSGVRAALAAV